MRWLSTNTTKTISLEEERRHPADNIKRRLKTTSRRPIEHVGIRTSNLGIRDECLLIYSHDLPSLAAKCFMLPSLAVARRVKLSKQKCGVEIPIRREGFPSFVFEDKLQAVNTSKRIILVFSRLELTTPIPQVLFFVFLKTPISSHHENCCNIDHFLRAARSRCASQFG